LQFCNLSLINILISSQEKEKTMREFNFRSPRLWMVVCLSLVLIGAALVVTLFSAGRSLAQADVPERAVSAALPMSMTPPPPLSPPIQTPEPGQVLVAPAVLAAQSDIEAVKFRPKVRIELGQAPMTAPSAEKQPERSHADLETQRAAPPENYAAPNYAQILGIQAWDILFYDGFEGIFPGSWLRFDTNGGSEHLWGDTNYRWQYGAWSAWPAEDGTDGVHPSLGYPNDVDSWLVTGPYDLSNMSDVFVGFGLWYNTEPSWDWIYFCASVEWPYFNCDYWSGYSDGWLDMAYWLTSYAGYSDVYFAWYFYSDSSIGGDYGYYGPYLDEVYVWGYDIDATPTPTPDPNGELIQNGSFETGDLSFWSTSSTQAQGVKPTERRPSLHGASDASAPAPSGVQGVSGVGVTSDTFVEGTYSAYLWRDGIGDDFLYQTFAVPADVTDVVLDFWFAVTTGETYVDTDFFCVSLRDPNVWDDIWVDLGCIDATDTTVYWQQVIYPLTDAQVTQVKGTNAILVFELYGDYFGEAGTGTTYGWVDYAHVYATGGSTGAQLDPNEPNDDSTSATSLACGATTTGVVGDALGGYDVDWFVLNNVPLGRIDVDIDAKTLMPPSALDSVVGLWDENVSLLTWNDDDGLSYDSYVIYTNTVDNATFFVSVEPYGGYGSADSFYNLTVNCADSGSGPPPGGTEGEEPDPNTWTVMLYLNAEDPSFESILTQYRTDIETFIGSKSSFLNVALLYDGSGSGDTTRYLVQPNGAYTDGVNRWQLGELNMGHPDTLSNFVTWAMDQYPAENYYLAIDDHGDGVYGISFDASSLNDQLTPPELYSALKSATHNGSRKIDIFDYEACLMGLAENAYDMREWVDYVVFFEQISWGLDTYPQYFGDLAATDTPLTVGQRIIDRYYVGASDAGYPHTISLIDTGQMEAVSAAVDNFGNTLMATATITDVLDARDLSQAFAADLDATNALRAEYVDLWDLANEANSLAPTQAAAVRAAVDAAVVHERHASGGVDGYIWEHGGAHGLSIYYPPSKSSSAFSSYVAETLYQMSQQGDWDEFLNWAVPSGARRGMSTHRSEIKLDGGDTFIYRYVYLPMLMK
jgi:hypothetical protein